MSNSNNITENDKAMLLEVIQSEEFKGTLKDGSTKLTKKIFALKDEVLQLEDRISDKRRILDDLDDAIARKELGEAYIKRNVMKSMRQLEEEHEVITEVHEIKELRELTGAQEVSFKNYCKSSKALVEIQEIVANGTDFEEGLNHVTGLDRSKRELISRGVQKLQEGTELLTTLHRIEHLYK